MVLNRVSMTTASYAVQFLFDYLLNLPKFYSWKFFSSKFKRCQLYGTKKLIEADVLEMKVKWDNKTCQQQYLFEQNGHHSNFVKVYFCYNTKLQERAAIFSGCNWDYLIDILSYSNANKHLMMEYQNKIKELNYTEVNLEKFNAPLTIYCFAPTCTFSVKTTRQSCQKL